MKFVYYLCGAVVVMTLATVAVRWRSGNAVPLGSGQKTQPDRLSERELSAWQQATQANTVTSFEAFILKHPDSKFVSEAKKLIETLSFVTVESKMIGAGTAQMAGQGFAFVLSPTIKDGVWSWSPDGLMSLYVKGNGTNYYLIVNEGTRLQIPTGTNIQHIAWQENAIYRIRGKVSVIPSEDAKKIHNPFTDTEGHSQLFYLTAMEIGLKQESNK